MNTYKKNHLGSGGFQRPQRLPQILVVQASLSAPSPTAVPPPRAQPQQRQAAGALGSGGARASDDGEAGSWHSPPMWGDQEMGEENTVQDEGSFRLLEILSASPGVAYRAPFPHFHLGSAVQASGAGQSAGACQASWLQ